MQEQNHVENGDIEFTIPNPMLEETHTIKKKPPSTFPTHLHNISGTSLKNAPQGADPTEKSDVTNASTVTSFSTTYKAITFLINLSHPILSLIYAWTLDDVYRLYYSRIFLPFNIAVHALAWVIDPRNNSKSNLRWIFFHWFTFFIFSELGLMVGYIRSNSVSWWEVFYSLAYIVPLLCGAITVRRWAGKLSDRDLDR